MPVRLLPLLSLLLALAALTAPAHAQQIRRCTGADGQTVFTDRRCDELGATARVPATAASAMRRDGDAGMYRYGCPRRLSQLVDQLRGAIAAHDVNRLSSLYLWTDLSNDAANRVLTRLEDIAERPLVDIAPLYPEPVTPLAAAVAPGVPAVDGTGTDAVNAVADAAGQPAPPAADAPAPQRPRPWGLRLEQTLANGSTPARTQLDLRRQYNCFWISF